VWGLGSLIWWWYAKCTGETGGRMPVQMSQMHKFRWGVKRQHCGSCAKRGKWINSRDILKAVSSRPYDGLTMGPMDREESARTTECWISELQGVVQEHHQGGKYNLQIKGLQLMWDHRIEGTEEIMGFPSRDG